MEQPIDSVGIVSLGNVTYNHLVSDGGRHEMVVGEDIQPGLYTADAADDRFGCYWARRQRLGGSGGIIASATTRGHSIVEILDSDVAFTSSGCGRWTPYVPPEHRVDRFGDGDWVVGEQIEPGTYAVSGAVEGCYWERGKGFGHEMDEVAANDFVDRGTPSPVTLEAGERFSTNRCGTWAPA